MRNYYAASERSQKLKYHIQTSGRSLHAQEVDFNDIRTTLQALLAIMDNCNSLHTNAYDEAITTPTEGSVRRAMAIQLIVNREFGLTKNENPLQGSFIVEEVTDLVEEAMLDIFLELNRRGGVLGAMESQYQALAHSGGIVALRASQTQRRIAPHRRQYLFARDRDEMNYEGELTRASQAEKKGQLNALRGFQKQHKKTAAEALARLHAVAVAGENIFAELMQTVQHASLGQITEVLYRAGGQYRRNL
jgi:methylmalonyl-CoA mutase